MSLNCIFSPNRLVYALKHKEDNSHYFFSNMVLVLLYDYSQKQSIFLDYKNYFNIQNSVTIRCSGLHLGCQVYILKLSERWTVTQRARIHNFSHRASLMNKSRTTLKKNFVEHELSYLIKDSTHT